MKNIYVNSKKYFNETILNILKRQSCCFLFFFLISFSVNAQITRTQIINNATPYTSFAWFANSCNLWSGTLCSGANIYRAPWVTTGTNISMPYCWGGWSTQTEYNTAMSGCKSAGQVCSSGGGGCTGLPSAPLSCAGGHDCSGFVTRAWGLTMKYSTSTLPSISTSIASSSVQPGDIFNIVGNHTRLVETNNGGSITVMEASGTDWKTAYHTYTPAQLSSYDPRCYNNVIGGCGIIVPPVCNNDDCLGAVTLFSNATCQPTLCSVDNATSDVFNVPSCDAFGGTILGAGVFFSFTPTTTQSYTITVTPTGTLDAVLVVYTGNCFNLQEYDCEDTPGGPGGTTTLTLTLNAGTQYTIRVYDYGATAPPIGSGGFNICITNSCVPPSNASSSATPNPACVGNTVNLSGSANGTITSWSWNGPSGFTASSQNPSVNNVQTNQAGTYTVTATNSCGSTSSSVNVTVNSQPTNPSASATPNPACVGNTVNLSGSANGTITSWSWNGPSGFTASSQNPSVNNVQTNQAGTYTVTATNSCGSTSSSVNVTVNSQPTNPSASATPNPACVGNTVNLSGSANGTITSWSWNGPSGFSSSSQNPSVNNIQTNQAGTYTVTATNSCGSTSTSVNVTVDAQPTNGSASATPNPACVGNTVNLSGSANGTITSWSWNGPSGFTASSQNPSVNNVQTNQAGTYTVTATNSCGSTSSSINIIINGPPVLSPLSQQGNYIVASPISLTDTIAWYYQSNLQTGQTNDSLLCVGVGNYYCIVSNSCGSATSNTININPCVTGINETNNANNISIYPNPTNGFLNIKVNGLANEKCKIILTNTLGQILNEKEFETKNNSNETQIDMKNLSSGIYFLSITSNKIEQTFKVQKQ